MTDIKRRTLLQTLSMLVAGSGALARTRNLQAAVNEAKRSVKDWPEMEYRTLGSTGFNGSRLIFGCGAALSRGQASDLLEPALDAGINVFDVGFRDYYGDAEMNLAPFLDKHFSRQFGQQLRAHQSRQRRIFLISKAMTGVDVAWDEVIDTATAKQAAKNWLRQLDNSLTELGVEHVDAYYVMAANNVSIVRNDEMYEAFTQARAAGKVAWWGLSTHQNAENVLLAAAETGRYALAQIAITPAGWYDWIEKRILDDGKAMSDLQGVLDRAHEAGMGLIGMKAGRFLAGRRFLGWGNPKAYDEYYDESLLAAKLTPFQRSYAYVLGHGLDAVNADMQVWQHLRENHLAASQVQRTYFG